MSKSVSLSFSPIEIGRGGLDDGAHFEVRDDGALVGRLTVMRKKLRWWPRDGSEPAEASWADFDSFMRARAPKIKAEA